jgi:hypothetical protein
MHPRRTTLAMLLSVLLVAGCSWPQWGAGAEHRGAGVAPKLDATTAGAWTARTLVGGAATTPVVDGNGAMFVVQGSRLLAIDPGSSAVIWAADLPAGTTAGGVPAVDTTPPATVFVTVATASESQLVGFDVGGVRNCNPVMRTCAPVFRAQLGTTASPPGPALTHGGRVFAHGAGDLEAFDSRGSTGCVTSVGTAVCTPLWTSPIGAAVSGIGPTATDNGTVYDTGTIGTTPTLFAIDEATGARRWTGTLDGPASATPSIGADGTVAVPAGTVVDAFAGQGCGRATCARSFRWAGATAPVRSTPAFDPSGMYATSAAGDLILWPAAGCGSGDCAPTRRTHVDRPAVPDGAYRQTPVLSGGMVLLLARRSISGADHVVLAARSESDGSEVTAWDLGAGGFAPGLTNASIDAGLIVAPVAAGVFVIGPPPIRPLASLSTSGLALSPAFDPSISDYTLRCAAGANAVGLTAVAVAGGTVRLVGPTATAPGPSLSTTVSLTPNQAAVVEATDAQGAVVQTWIRCLPPDFPAITFTPHSEAGTATPGWYLLGNNYAAAGTSAYAMVLDGHGTPVWYKHGYPTATNVTAVARNTLAFFPTLSIAFGTDPTGHYDQYSLATGAVQPIQTVGTPTDLHEFQTLPNGDHLLLSYPFKSGVDLTGLVGYPDAGPGSTIADCAVQEVDPSGRLVWDWRASDHIDPVRETTSPGTATQLGDQTVYDVFHCNSIDPNPNGNLLLSVRHANAVFEIRRSDGRLLWKLGGTPVNKDDATIIRIQNDPDGGFVQQHDVRYLPNGHISLFDNQTSLPARAMEYAVDFTHDTAQPVFSFAAPNGQWSCCMGDNRLQPDGHRVVGWGLFFLGDGLVMSELDAAGHDVLDLRLTAGTGAYRVTKVAPPFFDLDVLRRTAGQ